MEASRHEDGRSDMSRQESAEHAVTGVVQPPSEEFHDLQVERRDEVLIVRLNRPHQRNAMRLELRRELIQCLLGAESNENVTAIVITGAGDMAFSAGADLEELAVRTPVSEMGRAAELRRELPRVAETLGKPTVAAINGLCIGGGLEFALACTVRLASEKAVFSLPEVNLGVITGSGGSQRLPRAVGLSWAMYLLTTGESIDAACAARIGLVTEVVPGEQLVDRAVAVAKLMGSKSQMAFIGARDAVMKSFDVDLASGIEFERKAFGLCLGTGDKDKAVAEFFARRKEQRASHG